MPRPDPQRRAAIEEKIRNLVTAIASGGLRTSAALAERLVVAEAELAAQEAVAYPVKVKEIERLVERVMERYRALVAALAHSMPASDIEQARAALPGYLVASKWSA